jgi:hypothetical protein
MNEASFYEMLERIDKDLAQAAREARCECGGRLDSARYPRKPRGGPPHLGPGYDWRFSFCCALRVVGGDRRRHRFVTWSARPCCVLVLVIAMERESPQTRRPAHAHLGWGYAR